MLKSATPPSNRNREQRVQDQTVHPHADHTSLGRPTAWLLLLTAGLLWGLTFSLAKIAAEGGGHPIGINYWQSLIGCIYLIAVAIATRQKLTLRLTHIWFYAAVAILGTVIPGTIFYYAASRVSPGVLSITVSTVPIMTVVAAALLGIEKFKIARGLGVALGMLAILLLVGPQNSLADPSSIPWIFAVLFSAVCYSAEGLLVSQRIPSGISTLAIAVGMYLAASVILTPVVVLTDTFVPLAWPWSSVEWAIIGLAIVSPTAYSLFIFLIVRAGPVFASQTAYIVTFSGVLWGIAIFSEQHSAWIWISLVVMLVAMMLVTPRENESKQSPAPTEE